MYLYAFRLLYMLVTFERVSRVVFMFISANAYAFSVVRFSSNVSAHITLVHMNDDIDKVGKLERT